MWFHDPFVANHKKEDLKGLFIYQCCSPSPAVKSELWDTPLSTQFPSFSQLMGYYFLTIKNGQDQKKGGRLEELSTK